MVFPFSFAYFSFEGCDVESQDRSVIQIPVISKTLAGLLNLQEIQSKATAAIPYRHGGLG